MRLLVKKITPKRAELLNIATLRSELREVMEEVQVGVDKDFASTHAGWSTEVEIESKLTVGNAITLIAKPVGPGAKIWGYLNSGTDRHWVGPRNASALHFQPGYRSKTRPGRMSSGSGGPSGPFAFSKGHWVSGIEPRDWTGLIADKWKPEFKRIGENAMRRVARQ